MVATSKPSSGRVLFAYNLKIALSQARISRYEEN
jgi:hypothetical protein